ncbi:MAG: DUF4124 domain-containing protein [Gammaproteobacteria bacterium]|nr:DUF4124 domain-containing protein [Gammaproteobacteria bacterium]
MALLCLFTGSAVAEIYKCQLDGQTVFSQTPCAEDAEKYQVDYIKANEENAAELAERNARAREDLENTSVELEIRGIGLKIKKEQAYISTLQGQRDSELRALRNKKRYASNNLAGATWEQSISDEMNAINSRYDAMIEERQARINRLERDIDRLSLQ